MNRFRPMFIGHLNVQPPTMEKAPITESILAVNLSGSGLSNLKGIPSNVQRLILNDNNLSCVLSSSLVNLAHLIELHINSNELTSIPEVPSHLTLLTSLQVSNNKIKHVGISVNTLKHLRALYLSRNPIDSVLAEPLHKLKHLKTLHLGSCNLRDQLLFPFMEISSLTELNISFNQIQNLPSQMGNLSKLKSLDLTSNLLRSLPLEFFRLTRLHSLLASHNRFTSLIPLQSNVTFEKLQMEEGKEGNGNAEKEAEEKEVEEEEEELSLNVLKLSSLHRVDFTDNEIVDVPAEWFSLRHLKEFRLARNRIQQLRLRSIPRLEIIDLAQNQLQILPLGLCEANHLVTLQYEDNPLELPPPAVQRRGTSAVLNYLKGFSFFASSPSLTTTISSASRSSFDSFAEFVNDQSEFADCLLQPSKKDCLPIRSHRVLLECSGVPLDRLVMMTSSDTSPSLVTFMIGQISSALGIRKMVEFFYTNEMRDVSTLPLETVEELVDFAESFSCYSLLSFLTNFVITHVMRSPTVPKRILAILSSNRPKAFEPLKFEFLLEKNLSRQINSEKYSDMKFNVDGNLIPAHRVVVAARSEVWKQTLLGPFREAKERLITLSEVSPSAFKVILEHIYAKPNEEIVFDPSTISEVVLLSDQHALPEINVLAQRFMSDHVADDCVDEMFQFANHCNAYHLRARCIQFFALQRGSAFIEKLPEEMQEEIKAFRKHISVLGERDVFNVKK